MLIFWGISKTFKMSAYINLQWRDAASSIFTGIFVTYHWEAAYYVLKNIFFALRNLVPFVQFKKLEERPLGSVVFSNLQLY